MKTKRIKSLTLALGVIALIANSPSAKANPEVSGQCSASKFYVVFDETAGKFNDDGWLGSSDPMGTLKGGETYTLKYNGANSWTTEGYNEAYDSQYSGTYNGGRFDWHQFNMWGRIYLFSSGGEVFDTQWGLVGHILCDL